MRQEFISLREKGFVDCGYMTEGASKKLAIIAHDGKKADMVAFLKDHLTPLKEQEIIATGTTGRYVREAGFKVTSKLSGPMGGDAQIAAMVAENQIIGVIFFRDPLGKHPHEPDVQMLLRLCDVHNVPLATNRASAELLVAGAIQQLQDSSE